MRPEMTKRWEAFVEENVKRLPATTGIYQIADSDGEILDIGYVGGRSLFGLRGELGQLLKVASPGQQFRVEVHSQYLSRFEEVLMSHVAHHGQLPTRVTDRGIRTRGRLRPL